MRVIDIDFENVEITFYAKRISENKEVSYQGFVAGANWTRYCPPVNATAIEIWPSSTDQDH